MKPGVFPDGPIGFAVSIIGWEEAQPIIIAIVACDGVKSEYKFKRVYGEWRTGDQVLSEEEQDMLRKIWHQECDKRGLPNDRR